jgi:hypothetical protein
MTRTEAEELMKRQGCIDVKMPACLHITLCHWIDRYGRGEVPHAPMQEAYDTLRKIEPVTPAAKQTALFEKWRNDG